MATSFWNDSWDRRRACRLSLSSLLVGLSRDSFPSCHFPVLGMALVVVLDLCLDVSDTSTPIAVGWNDKPIFKNGVVYHYVGFRCHVLRDPMPVRAKVS